MKLSIQLYNYGVGVRTQVDDIDVTFKDTSNCVIVYLDNCRVYYHQLGTLLHVHKE